jgi:energy-converting hydrogenase Eha subunit F
MITMRMSAEDCYPWQVVPWKQMEQAVPLTPTERGNLAKHTGYNLSDYEVVRYSKTHIFIKAEDMAICLYHYERDFS